MPFSPTSEGFKKSRNKSCSGCRRPPRAACGTNWSRGGSGGREAQGGGCGEGGQTCGGESVQAEKRGPGLGLMSCSGRGVWDYVPGLALCLRGQWSSLGCGSLGGRAGVGVDGQDVVTARGLGDIQGSTGSRGDLRLSRRNRAVSQGRAGSAQGVERPSGAIWRMDWRESLGARRSWAFTFHGYLLTVPRTPPGTQL